MSKFLSLLTLRNIRLAITVALAVGTAFGVIAPNTATQIRNGVLVPLDLASAGTGDLL